MILRIIKKWRPQTEEPIEDPPTNHRKSTKHYDSNANATENKKIQQILRRSTEYQESNEKRKIDGDDADDSVDDCDDHGSDRRRGGRDDKENDDSDDDEMGTEDDDDD